jgi:hypothetical protein
MGAHKGLSGVDDFHVDALVDFPFALIIHNPDLADFGGVLDVGTAISLQI